jgi:hypothetical protein
MAAPAGAGGGPPAAHQPVRDFFGFAVKPELEELYLRFAPIYKAEEAERCCRWDQYIRELQEVVPRCGAARLTSAGAQTLHPKPRHMTDSSRQPALLGRRLD